jgi:hypothetical protein
MLRSQQFPVRIGILAAVLTLASWWPLSLPVPLVSIPAGFAQESAPNGTIIQGYAGVSIEAVSNISGNYVAETSAVHASSLMSSFQGFKGVGAANLAAGNLNNQGTYIGFAATGGNNALMTTDVTLATIHQNNRLDTGNAFYTATIGDSAFKGATGIVAVNQAAGNMNSQLKAITVCMGNAAAVLNNSQLSQINTNNTINMPVNGTMTANVSLDEGTFKDFKGVASVTQVAGNYNQVATSLRINVNFLP